jgi:hypothetical protein
MNKPSSTLLRQALFLLISGAIFSIAYAIHSDMSGSVSKPASLATFQAHWPYRPRFLTAWIAYQFFSGETLNGVPFRAAIAFVCWIPISLLTIRFAQKIQVAASVLPYVFVSFVLIMFAHYLVPNVAAQYYIYDMPAILFYLIVFLLLTSASRLNIVLGGILALVFTMNREPIAVAVFHAFAWWLVRSSQSHATSPTDQTLTERARRFVSGFWVDRETFFAMTAICMTLAGTVVLRQVLVYLLEGQGQGSFYVMLYEDGHIRVLANLKKILTHGGFFQQFIATGFGVVIYLPLIFRSQSLRTRALVIISIVPLFPLVFVGNFFTELRIYNEYVPLLACLLASVVMWGNLAGGEKQISNS